MQRISVYIPDETRRRISLVARTKSETESDVIRAALDQGLIMLHPQGSSPHALRTLTKLAEQIPTQGDVPPDAIENMDYYAWGGKKRE